MPVSGHLWSVRQRLHRAASPSVFRQEKKQGACQEARFWKRLARSELSDVT